MGFFKLLDAWLHDLLRSGQGDLRVLGIATRPKLGPDLESGNFAAWPDGAVIVAALNH